MKTFQQLCDKVQELWTEFHGELITMTELIASPKTAMGDLVDTGFLCREMETLLDDWRKECKARKELVTKILAIRSPAFGDSTIQGKLASVSLDATLEVEIPKEGTPEYDEILKYFHVDPEIPFKPHWKKVQELVLQRYQDGVPLPPGFGKQYTKTTGVFRRKHGQN